MLRIKETYAAGDRIQSSSCVQRDWEETLDSVSVGILYKEASCLKSVPKVQYT